MGDNVTPWNKQWRVVIQEKRNRRKKTDGQEMAMLLRDECTWMKVDFPHFMASYHLLSAPSIYTNYTWEN